MYEIKASTNFQKKYRKLTSKNPQLIIKIEKVIKNLSLDPKHNNLRTHKIKTSKHGEAFSSSVTGDLRIVWKKVDSCLVLLLLDIGGHEGFSGVYL